MRLIDADAARERITENIELVMGGDKFGSETIVPMIRNALSSERIAPTVDPVRHAVWSERKIRLGNEPERTVWACSACGTKSGDPTWYCHYCGARMHMCYDTGDERPMSGQAFNPD